MKINRKYCLILLTILFIFLFTINITIASEINNDTSKVSDNQLLLKNNIEKDVKTAYSYNNIDTSIKKKPNTQKDAKTSGEYIYVNSQGSSSSNGDDINNPTTLNRAVSIVSNDKVIYLVTNNGDNDTYKLNNELLISSKSNITIKGQEGKNIVLDGQNLHGIFNINYGFKIKFENINFINSNSTYGAIKATTSDIIFNNCSLVNNQGYDSGSIFTRYALLTINNTVIINSTSTNNGGVITTLDETGFVSIINSTFINNTAKYDGGVIYSLQTPVNVSTSHFINNSARDGGSLYLGINNYVGFFDIKDSIFEGNKATRNGGSIWTNYNNKISNNVFISPENMSCVFLDKCPEYNIDKNWWSSNSPNFNILTYGVVPDSWRVLKVENTTSDNVNRLTVNINTLSDLTSTSESLPQRKVYFSSDDGNFDQNTMNITSSINNNYYGNSNNIFVEVDNEKIKVNDKTEAYITINNITTTNGSNVIFKIKSNKVLNEPVSLIINNETINKQLVNGNCTINYQVDASVKTGNYSTTLVFSGNENFAPKNVTGYIFVNNIANEISIIPVNVTDIRLENVVLPSKYDLREEGLVTSIKNQGSSGTCWAFAPISSIESVLLKKQGINTDLSENNMKNILKRYSLIGDISASGAPNSGSNDFEPISYLVGWYGPVEENDDKFIQTSILSPSIDSSLHIQDVYIIRERKNATDNELIKQAIYTFGAVSTGVHLSGSSTNQYNNYDKINHGVSIVGWDDDYDKTNFDTNPPGNGAFIIKNSWGTGTGDNGYQYISYYDSTIGSLLIGSKLVDNSYTRTEYELEQIMYTYPDTYQDMERYKELLSVATNEQLNYVILLENEDNYDNIYQHDTVVNSLETFVKDYSIKNIYTAQKDEQIAAVGSYFMHDTSYTIKISVNGRLVHTQTGLITLAGYRTIKLNKFIQLNEGDEFTAELNIKYLGDGHNYVIVQYSDLYYTPLKPGESFIDINNGLWWDCYDYGVVAPIKVYTKKTAEMNSNLATYLNNYIITSNITNVDFEGYLTYYENNNPIKDQEGNIINKTVTTDAIISTIIDSSWINSTNITVKYINKVYQINEKLNNLIAVNMTSNSTQYTDRIIITSNVTNTGLNGYLTYYDNNNPIRDQEGNIINITVTEDAIITTEINTTQINSINITVRFISDDMQIVNDLDLINLTLNHIDSITSPGTVNITGKIFNNTQALRANLVLMVNNQRYSITSDANGIFSRSVSISQIGKNNVTVSYNDANHQINDTTSFALKQNTTLSITPLTNYVTVLDTVNFYGYLYDSKGKGIANANITIQIGNERIVRTTTSTGRYSLSYVPQKAGETISLRAFFEGDELYLSSSSKNARLIVEQIRTSITMSPIGSDDTVLWNSTAVIRGMLTYGNSYTHLIGYNITIRISNSTYSEDFIINYNASSYRLEYPTADLMMGYYKVEAFFVDPNGTYESAYVTREFSLEPIGIDSTLTDISNVTIGNSVTISATVLDENDKKAKYLNMTVTVNDETFTFLTNSIGKINFQYNTTKGGPVHVEIEPTDLIHYVFGYDEKIFYVISNTTITIDPLNEINVSDTYIITGNLTDERDNLVANQIVEFYLNNEKIGENITDNNGRFSFESIATIGGLNNVTVMFQPKDGLKYSSSNATFNVLRKSTQITVNPIENFNSTQTVAITGTLRDDDNNFINNALINITVNDDMLYDYTDEFGNYYLELTIDKVGKYNVTVLFNDNEAYTGSSNKTSFEYLKKYTHIELNPIDNIKVNNIVNITGYLISDIPLENKEIILLVNNNSIELTSSDNGYFNYSFVADTVGTYNISVKFFEDEEYYSSEKSASFNVSKQNTTLSINPEGNCYVDDIYIITGTLNGESSVLANQIIKVTVNQEEFTNITNNDGVYTVYYNCSSMGLKNITVIFTGNDKYNNSTANTTLNVTKIATSLSLNDLNPTYVGDIIEISGMLMGNNEGIGNESILLNINGESYPVTTSMDGSYSFNYTTKVEGLNTANVTYTSNYKYLSSYANTSFSLIKDSSKINIDSISTSIIGDTINISGCLLNSRNMALANETLIIEINQQNHTTKTLENGSFIYPYTTNITGENNITVYYNGSNECIGTYNDTQFIVNKKTTTISIDPIATTYVTETINITGNLKTNNSGIGNENIEIIINNIIFNTKTQENGSFTLNYTIDNIGLNNISVKYPGNDIYTNSSDNNTFLSKIMESHITLENINNSYVNDNVTITGRLTERDNALNNSIINITINQDTYSATTDSDGRYNFTFRPENADTYHVLVNYYGNSIINGSSNQTEFITEKKNTDIIINQIQDSYYKDIVTVEATLYNDENPLKEMEVNININGEITPIITDVNGTIKLDINCTVLGENNITVSYDGNDEYKNSVKNTSFMVYKESVELIINDFPNEIKIFDSLNITGRLTDKKGNPIYNASIIMNLNDTILECKTDTDGNYTYSIKLNESGNYNITVNFDGNEYYNKSTEYKSSVDVVKLETTITINPDADCYVDDVYIITGILTSEGDILPDAIIRILVNQEEFTNKTNAEGVYTLNYEFSSMGLRNITAIFDGNSTHKASNNTCTINVEKIPTSITINDLNPKYVGDIININGKLSANNTGLFNQNVTLDINGEIYEVKTDENGLYSLDYTTKQDGTNTIKVTYASNYKYLASNTTTSFNLHKQDTKIKINPIDNVIIGDNITITGQLLDYENNGIKQQEITIEINKQNQTTNTQEDGTYTINYTTNTAGQNNITIYYNGNNQYNPTQNNTQLTVNKKTTTITIQPIATINVTDTITITGTLNSNNTPLNNQKIIIKINSEEINTTTTNDGTYTLDYTIETVGINNITVEYAGNNIYENSSSNTTFNSLILESLIQLNEIDDCFVNDNVTIVGRALVNDKSLNNTLLIITVNQDTYSTITDDEGKYNTTFKPQTADIYNVMVNYPGNSIINASSNQTQFKSIRKDTNIIINQVDDSLYKDKIIISGILSNENNPIGEQTVKININNNITELLTNSSGSYFLEYDATIVGKNNVTVFYEGNNEYNPSKNNITFNVNKESVILSVNTIPDEIEANNYVNITGVLIDKKNNPVNNTEILIKMDDSNYTVQTDNEGLFNFSIKLNDTGTYTFTVKFNGNENYNSSEEFTYSLRVTKENTTITINPSGESYLEDIYLITGILRSENNLLNNASVRIVINGSEVINKTDENGVYKIHYNCTSLGLINISAFYDGNETYEICTANTTLMVVKIPTSITVDPINTSYVFKDIVISGKLLAKDNGLSNQKVSININGEIYEVDTDENGTYSLDYTTKLEGLNIIKVSYASNYKYLASNANTSFNLQKQDTKIKINPIDDVIIGDKITITGQLLDYENNGIKQQEITIEINKQNQTTNTQEDGTYTINYTTNTTGQNNITIYYKGNNQYNPTQNNTQLTVNKKTTTITINPNADCYVDDVYIITGILTSEGDILPDAIIRILVNQEEFTNKTNAEGVYTLNYKFSSMGLRNITAIFDENSTHKASNNTSTINVKKIPTSITINDLNPKYVGDKININGKLSANNTGLLNQNVTLDINGEIYQLKTDANGVYSLDYTTKQDGTNTIKVTYASNYKYLASNANTSFNLHKQDTKIKINPINDVIIGDKITITGQLLDYKNNGIKQQEITIRINNEEFNTTTINNGTYTIPYTTNTAGQKNITIYYKGNNQYNPTQNNTQLTVNKKTTTITIQPIAKTYVTDTITITGKLNSNNTPLNNQKIRIKINNEEINTTTSNDGTYTINYKLKVIGDNNITVTYPGNDVYLGSSNKTTAISTLMNSKVLLNKINDCYVNDNVSITGKLLVNGNVLTNTPITIYINQNSYNVKTDSLGNYNMIYTPNDARTLTVIVKYNGTSLISASSNQTQFTSRQKNTNIVIEAINNSYYKDNITIKGKLSYNNVSLSNKVVDVNINGQLGKYPTDSNGFYYVNHICSTIGVNNITVSYAGDNEYKASSNKISFNVYKESVQLEVNSINNEIKVNNYTNIAGSLKDKKNNPLVNTNIVIKVNNTSYTAKTDNNGMFNLSLKINKTGNYSITAKFDGNEYYNPSNEVKGNVNVIKRNVTVTVLPVKSIVGEKFNLTAIILDEYGEKVSGGNLVFKINGVTLKSNGRFDNNKSLSPMKFSVKNGIVNFEMLADKYIRDAKNITSSYSGSTNYESASTLNSTEAQVQLRYVGLNVTTSKVAKQGVNTTFNVNVYDITPHGTNDNLLSVDAKVMFKVNGVTLKDKNGNPVYAKVNNNRALFNYYVAPGTGGIDSKGNVRNYSVTAIYTNPNYYPSDSARNVTSFTVERSALNISASSIVINTNARTISVKASIKDYLGNMVTGTNKVCIKINGISLKDSKNRALYFNVKNGVIDLSNISIPKISNYKSVEIVTGERQAYLAGNLSTTNFTLI